MLQLVQDVGVLVPGSHEVEVGDLNPDTILHHHDNEGGS